MNEEHKGDEKKVKGHPTWVMGKKTYFWCSHHNYEQGQWVIYNPDECKNKPTTATEKKEKLSKSIWQQTLTQSRRRMGMPGSPSIFVILATIYVQLLDTYFSFAEIVAWSYQQCLMS